ncbi:MAG: hypothetical protein GY679_01565 [Mycoplasma sp.]|nr:hypothetical protein [Mycoplasma sp.]
MFRELKSDYEKIEDNEIKTRLRAQTDRGDNEIYLAFPKDILTIFSLVKGDWGRLNIEYGKEYDALESLAKELICDDDEDNYGFGWDLYLECGEDTTTLFGADYKGHPKDCIGCHIIEQCRDVFFRENKGKRNSWSECSKCNKDIKGGILCPHCGYDLQVENEYLLGGEYEGNYWNKAVVHKKWWL